MSMYEMQPIRISRSKNGKTKKKLSSSPDKKSLGFFKLSKVSNASKNSEKVNNQKIRKPFKTKIFGLIALTVLISVVVGFIGGMISGLYFYLEVKGYLQTLDIEIPEPTVIEKMLETSPADPLENPKTISQEEAVVQVVESVSPAVVSIVVTKDLPVYEQVYIDPFGDGWFQIPQYRQKGTEEQEIGGGTGFIISTDGMVVTNKHVVVDEDAHYSVLTNDGQKFSADILARDPAQDLAVLRIQRKNKETFKTVKLGNSSEIKIGQTVVAIGNALGEFRNTISVGVISGLGRTITATGAGTIQTLEDVIQTDAAINHGNSGGPLLNLKGEVVGINTATAVGAQSIGFAIPIDKVKKSIEQVITKGKIVYPFLGIRYVIVNAALQEKYDLLVDYGALILEGDDGEPAVTSGSAAATAGLQDGDIILECDGEKIDTDNPLDKTIQKKNPGDRITLKFWRGGKEQVISVVLGERSD